MKLYFPHPYKNWSYEIDSDNINGFNKKIFNEPGQYNFTSNRVFINIPIRDPESYIESGFIVTRDSIETIEKKIHEARFKNKINDLLEE